MRAKTFTATCRKCKATGRYTPAEPDYEVRCCRCSGLIWRPRGKQMAYIEAYDGNARSACLKVGYSSQSVDSMVGKMRVNPYLVAAISGRETGKTNHEITRNRFDMPGVQPERRVDCRGYDACLDRAARANLYGFDCAACGKYERIERPERLTMHEVLSCVRLLQAVFEL